MTMQSEHLGATGASATGTCGLKPQGLPRLKPITVNGVTIPRDAIARETQNHPAAKPVDAWMTAARALVVGELLLQEARRLAISPAPLTDDEGRRETADEALVRQLVEQEVRTPVADEAACRRIYETRRSMFRSSEIFAVRHMLFAADPSDEAARQTARAKAEATIATLILTPERFEEIAVTHSDCPSRNQGGNLGQVVRGNTVPEFESALYSAPIGIVAPAPVETRYGFHVVIVDARLDGQQLPFEVVHQKIASWLTDRAQHDAIRQYIAMLVGRAEISGIDMNKASSLTVG